MASRVRSFARSSRLFLSTLVALAAIPSFARADELRAHATLGGAHAVTEPQSREFGFGVAGSASLELPLGRAVGVEAKLSGLVLAKGDPPSDPSLARQGTGTAVLATGGVRVRPFTEVAGPWASAGLGYAQTGSRGRLGIDAMLGWDWRVGREGRWDVGPYAGFQQLVEPDDSLRPEDARIVSIGIHVGLGVPPKPVPRREPEPPPPPAPEPPPPTPEPPPRADRDQDTVFDDEDACPDVPGIRTDDPKTNGCPAAAGIQADSERIHLDDTIHFDLDSPRVRSASWPLVKRLAAFINANPAIGEVTIEGHADATGTEEHNLRLSRERAEAVKRMLVRYGVDGDRLKSEAFGRSRLRVQTTKPERMNRRVEFWITRTKPEAGQAGEKK